MLNYRGEYRSQLSIKIGASIERQRRRNWTFFRISECVGWGLMCYVNNSEWQSEFGFTRVRSEFQKIIRVRV